MGNKPLENSSLTASYCGSKLISFYVMYLFILQKNCNINNNMCEHNSQP